MKEKIKKISKYVVNGLNFVNLLLVGLAEVWGWKIDSISKSIIVIAGAISVYLVSGKMFETPHYEQEDIDMLLKESEEE